MGPPPPHKPAPTPLRRTPALTHTHAGSDPCPGLCTHLSRSLKTRTDVLYILMARSWPAGVIAWYTLASLPVEMQPWISLSTPRFSILNRTWAGQGLGEDGRGEGSAS